MKFFVTRILNRVRDWTLKWAHTSHMAVALFFIAFIEASFFPIPPDILLVAILLINSKRWWYYAGLTTIGSILGAILGYVIGWSFYEVIGQKIVEIYHLQGQMNLIGIKFSQYSFLTVFTAALTPIPFKLITISAGLFKIPIWSMIFAAIIGRGLRYFIIAFVIRLFGEKINHLIYKYFNILSVIFILLLIGGFLVVQFLF